MSDSYIYKRSRSEKIERDQEHAHFLQCAFWYLILHTGTLKETTLPAFAAVPSLHDSKSANPEMNGKQNSQTENYLNDLKRPRMTYRLLAKGFFLFGVMFSVF